MRTDSNRGAQIVLSCVQQRLGSVLTPVLQNLPRWFHFRTLDVKKNSSLTRSGPPLTAPGGSGVPADERVPDHVLNRVRRPPHVPKCVCRAPTLQQLGSCLRAPVFFSRLPPKTFDKQPFVFGAIPPNGDAFGACRGRVLASRTVITFKEPRLLPFPNFLGEVCGAAPR